MMPYAPLLAQSDTAFVTEGLALMAVGMLVVFTALLLLLAVIMGIRKLTEAPVYPALTPEPAAPLMGTDPPADHGLSPERLAVIAAAAAVAVRKPVRVRRVSVLTPSASTWARSGRRNIMTSHRPHKR